MLRNARRIAYLLPALLALVLTAQATGAQDEGSHFKTESAYAEFSWTDEAGIVTTITVYAADDQLYTEKGDGGGAPERVSKTYVTVDQYDPTCGGGKLTTTQEPGDPSCFSRSWSGGYPGKDGGSLPDDTFVVSNHQLDGAWLNVTLTLVTWDSEGNSKYQDATISLAWTPTSDVYQIHRNGLDHSPPVSDTFHVNAHSRDAVATGTIFFDGTIFNLESYFGWISDFQQVNT